MIKQIIYDNIKHLTTEITDGNSCEYSSQHDIIVKTAEDLLYIIALLRQGGYQIKNHELYNLILEKIDNFVSTLNKFNVNIEQANEAKYLICASIDEALLSVNNFTEAGYNESLISYYYREELGGEHFFNILEELYNQDIQQKLPLLNLAYLLLCLGFEGKYGVKENGHAILREIKEKIRSLIERYDPLIALSDQKNLPKPHILTKSVRLRIFITMSLLVLTVYISFLISLSCQKQELYELITNPSLEQ